MGIVLLAMIGAHIHASVAYWICFGIYCAMQVVRFGIKAVKEMK